MTASEGGAVLVVEGDWDVVHTYRRWLEGTHAIREASDGGMALDQFDEDVDADHLVDDSRFVATPLGGADARR